MNRLRSPVKQDKPLARGLEDLAEKVTGHGGWPDGEQAGPFLALRLVGCYVADR